MNLELLRRTRLKRNGLRGAGFEGQRRTYFILDRATKKFPGDIALWLQYIEYAKRQKSYKKLSQIFSNVLRLHPSRPELWILAANYALVQREDITEARSHLQRGLRFRRQAKDLWIEFAKLEMIYIAQLRTRTSVLGVQEDPPDALPNDKDGTEDLILLPAESSAETDLDSADQRALKALSSTPALSGAIPKAVYDNAKAVFPGDVSLQARFFDVFADLSDPYCSRRLCRHVMDDLLASFLTSPLTRSRQIRTEFVGVDPCGPYFPAALASMLGPDGLEKHEKTLSSGNQDRARFYSQILLWLAPYLRIKGIDDACMQVLRQMTRMIWGRCQLHISKEPDTMVSSDLQGMFEFMQQYSGEVQGHVES